MRASLRTVLQVVALLALPAMAGAAAIPAAPPSKVTICLHTGSGNIQLEVSETAAMRLWELGLASFGACGP
jgi:hypothetical protein